MRPIVRPGFALFVAGALLVASCSEPTAPSDPGTADLTSLLNDMSLGNVPGASAVGSPVAGVVLATGPSVAANACTFSSDAGQFVCPTVTVNGLTFTRKFILRDATGHVQSQFGPSVASIQSLTTVKGTVTSSSQPGGSGTFTVDRSEDMTLTGIHTENRTLNGGASSKLDGTIVGPSGSLQLSISSTETTEKLVLPKPRSSNRWPQSGTITSVMEMSMTPNGQQRIASSSRHTITFNGTSVVTITITSGFGTGTCTIDLAQPGPQQVCVVS
jgi:hypothetical protein